MVYYYDNGSTGTPATTSSTNTITGGGTCSVVVESTTTVTGSCTGGNFYYSAPRRREIIVEHPGEWKDEQHAAFIRLVNEEAKTCGWQITMLFRGGDLALVDPNIEVRSMKDFVPLLKDRASWDDRQIIETFFKANPA